MNIPMAGTAAPSRLRGERIRIRGTVQGVGLRPAIYRIACVLGVRGRVANDSEGVLIEAWGDGEALDAFVQRIEREAPPLARIGSIEREAMEARDAPGDFRIVANAAAAARTHVAPDAATCPACA